MNPWQRRSESNEVVLGCRVVRPRKPIQSLKITKPKDKWNF